ncbi:MAG: hypothetical protein R2850_13720 [Bacteroidia bacterium]
MKALIFILALILHSQSSSSQSVEVIGKSVYNMQLLRLQYRNKPERDSVFNAFDIFILGIINEQFIGKKKIEDLIWQAEQMKIDNINSIYTDYFLSMLKFSSNRHLITFGYDLLDNGDFHLYRNYLFVKGQDGKFRVFEKTGLDKTSKFACIEIKSLSCNGRLMHILTEYATNDKTLHSQRIRFFEENDDGIFECFNCMNPNQVLTITSKLNQFPSVKIDDESKILSYKEFIFKNEILDYSNEYKEIKLNVCECF